MISHTLCRLLAVWSVFIILHVPAVMAQPTSDSPLAARPNGMRSVEPTHHVFINATVHHEPGVVWPQGYIEIRDGLVVGASDISFAELTIPAGAVVHDLTGEHVYAAFIDPYIEVDAPRPDEDTPGRHWNEGVIPRRSALDGGGVDAGTSESRRSLGFGAGVIVPRGGVFAGSAAVVSLGERPGDMSAERVEVYRDGVFHALDFETNGWGGPYPTSRPGAVALMRQTLIDADWQAQWAPTLDGLNPANALTPLEDGAMPLLFDCSHELEHFLAADIVSEFARPAVIVGNGMEFKWLDGIAELGLPMIVPLRFPAKPDVSSVGKAESVELETMMAWEQAPTNPRRLVKRMEGVDLALTASMLPKGRDFHDELRLAIKNGLSEDDALAMLTTGPARIAAVEDQVGTIEAGKRANLLVTSGLVFDEDTEFHDIWIDGQRHELNDRPGPSFDGDWRFYVGPEDEPFFEMMLAISGSNDKPKVVGTETWSPEGEEDEHSAEARRVSIEDGRISFLLDDEDDEQVTYIISGVLVGDDRMLGSAVAADDSKFEWAGRRVGEVEEDVGGGEDGQDARPTRNGERKEEEEEFEQAPPLPGYPFGPYAVAYEPSFETLLVNNATIWTSTDLGRYDTGWLLIRNGRIVRIEPGSAPEFLLDGSNPEIVVMDATGKHLTPGIVDAHSHTGLFRFGVNEAGQAVTAEVRIADSLDPGHINWYRQLAMGVTTVNSLHGSANPIGGQNQIHKVRWGARKPSDMRAEGARAGIKFALGENVKQSNSNRKASERTRYPQSRMGVETLIRDRFTAAREYAEMQSRLGIENVRRDLELDALAEILTGERLLHSHSYRQDEILMLCRVAEDFGFKIGTFQHGLEVYKVAEAVREHAIGASLFSDWWMYKVEVMDAIPFAGPLQTEAGVMTSYNSDSDEMARRLNTEAAKAVKYSRPGSGMTEEEALKFVTINPANQIGAGHLVGSLEEGKDADFVIWSHNPLSTRAVAENVYIDGREYYSLEQDKIFRDLIARERQRLIQKIIASPKRDGTNGDAPEQDADKPLVDGPTKRRGVLADWMQSGFHPDDMRPGDCGCGIINHEIYYESRER